MLYGPHISAIDRVYIYQFTAEPVLNFNLAKGIVLSGSQLFGVLVSVVTISYPLATAPVLALLF